MSSEALRPPGPPGPRGARNLRLTVEYDGTAYAGWQRQPDRPTVQGQLEDAIAQITGARSTVYGAGRTDAGVHARGQVANVFADHAIPCGQLRRALNAVTPADIAVLEVSEAPLDFDACRSAIGKRYAYALRFGDAPPALDRHRTLRVPGRLDLTAMRAAAARFVGEHDFVRFQRANSPRLTTVRALSRCEVCGGEDGEVRVVIEGSGFLYKMCRAIVGTLLEVGRGARAPQSIDELLRSRSGEGCEAGSGPTAPAHGLVLERVFYDEGGGPVG